jgi:hypothetical protein
MRRRSKASSEPAKARGRKLAAPERASGTEAARSRGSSAAGQHSDIAQLSRELAEARQEQTATADVLHIISSSSASLDGVFTTILENATRLCEAKFGVLFRSEEDALRAVALHGAPPAYAEERRANPIIRPNPKTALGRAVASSDILKEPNYDYFDAPSGYTAAQALSLAAPVPYLRSRWSKTVS